MEKGTQPNNLNKQALIDMYMYTYQDFCHAHNFRVHMKKEYREINQYRIPEIVDKIKTMRSQILITY